MILMRGLLIHDFHIVMGNRHRRYPNRDINEAFGAGVTPADDIDEAFGTDVKPVGIKRSPLTLHSMSRSYTCPP